MLWFLLTILAALGDAAYYSLIKNYVTKIDQYVLASGVFLSSSLVGFIVSLLQGFPALGLEFLSSLLVTVVVNVIAAIFYFKSLKTTDISLALPMISFTSLFLLLTSWVILGEFPSSYGLWGVLLIVIGSYVLNTSQNSTSLLDPFKEMFHNKGVLMMLGVAFLYSFGANFDKKVMLNSNPAFALVATHLVLGLSFLLIVFKRGTVLLSSSYRLHYKTFLGIGLVLSVGALLVYGAFQQQIVPYVISVKRLSILFAVLFGGLLFKEKNIGRRLLGAIVMVAGAVVIVMVG